MFCCIDNLKNACPFPAELLVTKSLTPVELLNILVTFGMTKTIDFEAFYLLYAAIAEGTPQQGVFLAQGVQPVAGTDGWFEMAVKTLGENPEYTEDALGNVDLRTLYSHTEVNLVQKLCTASPSA